MKNESDNSEIIFSLAKLNYHMLDDVYKTF